MPVIDRIKDFQNDLVAIRRDIHAHPEIGFEETRTSAIVADLLETWGITVQTGSRPKQLRSARAFYLQPMRQCVRATTKPTDCSKCSPGPLTITTA